MMGLLDIWFLNYGEKEEAIIKIFQKVCINLLVETIDLFNSVLHILKHSHSPMEVKRGH